MQAVLDDADWHAQRRHHRRGRARRIRARDLWRQIAAAAWECADPGLQFDTTINRWHTAHATGRINASNPCFPGDTLVHTDKGLIAFAELIDRGTGRRDVRGVHPRRHEPRRTDGRGRAHVARGVHDHGPQRDRPPRASPTAWSCAARQVTRSSRRTAATSRPSELTADDSVRILDVATPAVSAEWSTSGADRRRTPTTSKGDRIMARHRAPREVDRRARALPRVAGRRRLHLRRRGQHRCTAPPTTSDDVMPRPPGAARRDQRRSGAEAVSVQAERTAAAAQRAGGRSQRCLETLGVASRDRRPASTFRGRSSRHRLRS